MSTKNQFRISKVFDQSNQSCLFICCCANMTPFNYACWQKSVKLTSLPFPVKNLSNWHCLYRFRCMELPESTRTPPVPFVTRPSPAATVWPDTCWPTPVKNPLFATFVVQHTTKELTWIPTKSKTTTYEYWNICALSKPPYMDMQDGQVPEPQIKQINKQTPMNPFLAFFRHQYQWSMVI